MTSTEVREASGGVFVRQATGLVREVSPFSTFVFNMAGQPTAAFIATTMFWTWALWPGGNIYLALLFALIVSLVIAVVFGLFSSAIPRSGGDYVLVSRALHPAIGLVSSFLWVGGVIASIAFVAIAFVTEALAPSFSAIGMIGHSTTFTNWGNTLATSNGWHFGIGAFIIIVSSAFLAGGWRWTTRVLVALWGAMMVGLALVGIVLLATSSGTFVHHFNHIAAPITGQSDSYHGTIAAAHRGGFDTTPTFSLSQTWPMWGAILSLSIWTWLSVYVAGEIRKARNLTQTKTMASASIVHIGIATILTVIFFARFGHQFFYAINEINGTPAYKFASPPYYTFLTSIAGNSTFLAWIMLVTFAAVFPYWIIQNTVCVTRPMFAWAFDGIIPMKVANVNRKVHAPVVAIVITTLLNLGALVWGVWGGSSFFGIIAEGALLALYPILLVSICAVIFPYKMNEVWQGSATTKKIAGIPLISIAGLVSTALCVVIFYLYLHYPGLGIKDGKFFRDTGIVVGAALLLYVGARLVRTREGFDFVRMTEEIPPE
jgi:amino acid transporter